MPLEETAEVFVGGTQSASGLMRTAAPISASGYRDGRPLGSEEQRLRPRNGPADHPAPARSQDHGPRRVWLKQQTQVPWGFLVLYCRLPRTHLVADAALNFAFRSAIESCGGPSGSESRVRAESSQGRRARSLVSWEPPLPSLCRRRRPGLRCSFLRCGLLRPPSFRRGGWPFRRSRLRCPRHSDYPPQADSTAPGTH